jgi:hypothetical protein
METFGAPRGIALLALLLALLSGCKSFKPWPVNHLLPPTKLDTIIIQSAVDSSDEAVVLLDIVFDFGAEDAVGAKVPDKAQDWFANRTGLTFSLQNSIKVKAYQVPPNRMTLPPVKFPDGYKQARRVMVFANFQQLGTFFEIDITKLKRIRIDLLEKNLNVVNL